MVLLSQKFLDMHIAAIIPDFLQREAEQQILISWQAATQLHGMKTISQRQM